MKTAYILATHYSEEIRPYGYEMLHNCLKSLRKSVKDNYKVFLFDNSSTEKFYWEEFEKYFDIEYTYVEDQTKEGLTGCWNRGVQMAVEQGFDRIIMISDDLIFNKSLNYLVEEIKSDDTIYGGTTTPSGVGHNGTWQELKGSPQALNEPMNDLLNVTGICEPDKLPTEGFLLNGFLFGFTKGFYNKFKRKDNNIFNPAEKHKWGSQECELQIRTWPMGAKSVVVGRCWIYHIKLRTWKYHNSMAEQLVTANERMKVYKKKHLEYEKDWQEKMEEERFYESY